MISLTVSRGDWRTGSIPELPLLRMQKFKIEKGWEMKEIKKCLTDKSIVNQALKDLEITVTKDKEVIMSLSGDEVILKNGYEVTVNQLS